MLYIKMTVCVNKSDIIRILYYLFSLLYFSVVFLGVSINCHLYDCFLSPDFSFSQNLYLRWLKKNNKLVLLFEMIQIYGFCVSCCVWEWLGFAWIYLYVNVNGIVCVQQQLKSFSCHFPHWPKYYYHSNNFHPLNILTQHYLLLLFHFRDEKYSGKSRMFCFENEGNDSFSYSFDLIIFRFSLLWVYIFFLCTAHKYIYSTPLPLPSLPPTPFTYLEENNEKRLIDSSLFQIKRKRKIQGKSKTKSTICMVNRKMKKKKIEHKIKTNIGQNFNGENFYWRSLLFFRIPFTKIFLYPSFQFVSFFFLSCFLFSFFCLI